MSEGEKDALYTEEQRAMIGPGTWAKVLQANSFLLALATFYSLS